MTESVSLFGSSRHVGHIQGTLQRKVLQERIGRIMRRAEATHAMSTLRDRAHRLGENVALVAPHWLEESEALCKAAGIELWQMLALNSLPLAFWQQAYFPPSYATGEPAHEALLSKTPPSPHAESECTAFLALGSATQNGVTLFHKNRDERDEVQWMGAKGLDDCHAWIGGSDIGHLGIAQLYAAGNWAGANNSGSQIPAHEYVDCAFNDGHILRYLAERCADLDDILTALEDLLARQLLGGAGVNVGMIFLFADATRGLAVECTSRRMAHEWFSGSTIGARTNHFLLPEIQERALPATSGSLRRLERAREMLNTHKNCVTVDLCHAIACDRAGAPEAGIARNPSDDLGSVTVSAATAALSEDDAKSSQVYFYNGHPHYAPCVPLAPQERQSQMEWVSGMDNQFWRAQRGSL